jgi:hypothetical protein
MLVRRFGVHPASPSWYSFSACTMTSAWRCYSSLWSFVCVRSEILTVATVLITAFKGMVLCIETDIHWHFRTAATVLCSEDGISMYLQHFCKLLQDCVISQTWRQFILKPYLYCHNRWSCDKNSILHCLSLCLLKCSIQAVSKVVRLINAQIFCWTTVQIVLQCWRRIYK